jgi:hypothetical protein
MNKINTIIKMEKLEHIPLLPTINELIYLASKSKEELLSVIEEEYKKRNKLLEYLDKECLLTDFNGYLA